VVGVFFDNPIARTVTVTVVTKDGPLVAGVPTMAFPSVEDVRPLGTHVTVFANRSPVGRLLALQR
jgi:hypothetical protein